ARFELADAALVDQLVEGRYVGLLNGHDRRRGLVQVALRLLDHPLLRRRRRALEGTEAEAQRARTREQRVGIARERRTRKAGRGFEAQPGGERRRLVGQALYSLG